MKIVKIRFKQNTITIEKSFTNNEIKTEIIELNDNITIESTIKLAEKLSKIKQIAPLNLELELAKEHTKQLELKTKQMEIQLEMLKYQQPQIQVQQNIQEQQQNVLEENLSEELQFHKWLNENVINELGNVLIWKEVMLKLMNRRIGSGVSSKFKKYFENWYEIKFPNVNSVYKVHRTPNGSLHGYLNFKLK